MITKGVLDARIQEVELEKLRVVAATVATYDGALQELKRLRDSLDSEVNPTKENTLENKEN